MFRLAMGLLTGLIFFNLSCTNQNLISSISSYKQESTAQPSPEEPSPSPTPPPTPVPPPPTISARGTWVRLIVDPVNDGTPDLDAWANTIIIPSLDRIVQMDWSGQFQSFLLENGAYQGIIGGVEQPAGGGAHNRTIEFDPINNRIWVSNGSFGNYAANAMTYWDLSTNTRGTLGDMGDLRMIPHAQSAMEFDAVNRRLVAWGGWGGGAVKTMSLDPIGSQWVYSGTTGEQPPITAEADKFTDYKTVTDSKRNRWITVSGYPTPGKLFILPQNLSAWSSMSPAGHGSLNEFPPLATYFVYDSAGDQIIGFSGSAATVTGQPVYGEPRTTWRLKLGVPEADLKWEKLASASYGDFVPPSWALIAAPMVWDARRGRAVLLLCNGVNPYEIWAYYPPQGP